MSFNLTPQQIQTLDLDFVQWKLKYGTSFGQMLQTYIFGVISASGVSIQSAAEDVDSLCLGGGHFTQDEGLTTGLTFAYNEGRFLAGKTPVSVAAGTIALSASTTNYVEVSAAGTVSKNTSGFTAGRLPLWTIVTGGSSITAVTISKHLLTLIAADTISGELLTAAGRTKVIEISLGTISATYSLPLILPSFAATLASGRIVVTTSITQSDTDYWTFDLTNKGGAGAGTTKMVDGTSAANSTKTTGGSGITAVVSRALTLSGTPANLDAAANDVALLTITKNGSAANLVNALLRLELTTVL